jgi:hypothetical protein
MNWKAAIPSYPDMSVAELKREIRYVDPPTDLALPHYNADPDGEAWQRLEAFFKQRGIEDVYGAMTVYCAQQYDVDLYAAEDIYAEYQANVYESFN